MHPKSVLITGANRGIGLEFVKQFLNLPTPPKIIFATCRNPEDAKELQDLAASHPVIETMKLDLSDAESIETAKGMVSEKLQGAGLNILINNAGMREGTNALEELTPEPMLESFTVNIIGPMLVTKAFLPMLRAAASKMAQDEMSCSRAAIINISSKVGSIDDNTSGGRYPYRISKCGLNMMNKNFSLEFKPCGILSVVLHPGWVKTTMGGPNALITTEESVAGLMTVMDKLKEDDTGKFFDFRGKIILW